MSRVWLLPVLIGLARPTPGQTITEFSAFGRPTVIAAGPDGNVWFAEHETDQICRITSRGAITRYQIPTRPTNVQGLAAGPDGAVWFVGWDSGKIGRLTLEGEIREFAPPTRFVEPSSIAVRPDGNLWVTQQDSRGIIRVTTGGEFQEFPIQFPANQPYCFYLDSIVSGPGQAVWFLTKFVTRFMSCLLVNPASRVTRLGAITRDGRVMDFPPPGNPGYSRLAAGGDGNLWYTAFERGLIGRVAPPGVVEFPLPAGSGPWDLTWGPDGNIWFTEYYGNKIGRMTPEGELTEFPIPTPGSRPTEITVGPDGSIWFLESNARKVGRVNLPPLRTLRRIPFRRVSELP